MKKFVLITMIATLLWGCTKQEEKITDTPPKSDLGKQLGLTDGLYGRVYTNRGEIIVKLFYQRASLTVTNFVGLAEGTLTNYSERKGKPYFDGISFHKVVHNYIIQTGDPTGSGRGGPGYVFPDEFHLQLKHDKKGILSMANAGPDMNGSQFFITRKATPHLDGKHTVFGEIIRGMETFDKLKLNDTILNVTIIRVGESALGFKCTDKEFKKRLLLVKNQQKEKAKKGEQKKEERIKSIVQSLHKKYPNATTLDSGIRSILLKKGKGESTPQKGNSVKIHYTAQVLDGPVFDNTYKKRKSYTFTLGKDSVVDGWEKVIPQMKKGEKRKIIVPPQLAYGKDGRPPVVPPESWLVYELELLTF